MNGGSEEKLSEEQSQKLAAHLEAYTYLYVKDITAYVETTFKVSYSVPGMTHWLKRHRFSYKKPAVVPGKANLEQQQAWLREYEKLRLGLPEDETIGFIDGVHPTHIHKQPQKLGIWQGGAPNLGQAQPTSKQLNLNKLGDGDGSQSRWLPTPPKTNF